MISEALVNIIDTLIIDILHQANLRYSISQIKTDNIVKVICNDYIQYNSNNLKWFDRDRFIISNDCAHMFLYSLLHMSRCDIPIIKLKSAFHTKTSTIQQISHTPDIVITTGSPGQELANAVGLAVAERTLGAQFNRDNHKIIDHYTYVFMNEGSLMEGISHEVSSLAGTLKLNKLIGFYIYDTIPINEKTQFCLIKNIAKRFEAYNWHVIHKINGHSQETLKKAIYQARSVRDKPSLIICSSQINFSLLNNTVKEELSKELYRKETKQHYQELEHLSFNIPQEIYINWNLCKLGEKIQKQWNEKFIAYQHSYPDLADEFIRRISGKLPKEWEKKIQGLIEDLQANPKKIATRKASQNTLNTIGKILPELLGGSADLAPSNLTIWSGSRSLKKDTAGNYIHYGVREFGMTAIANGIAKHGGFLPYTATFLIFVEYALHAVHMSALMKIHHIMIYTHDSIGLGEDGPTHQAVEQLAGLRLMSDFSTWRPCDQVETAVGWKLAVERHSGPTALILSRQNLTQIDRTPEQVKNIARGGYILKDSGHRLDVILIATGSEVEITLKAAEKLMINGYSVRVVSLPSTDVFDSQEEAYRESVLPNNITARVAVEAGIADYWYKYVGLHGAVIGMTSYGESAPADKLFTYFGFTVENIVEKALSVIYT